jgi:hypothetical protein
VKSLFKLAAIPSLLVLVGGAAGCTGGDDDDNTGDIVYVQIERIGRPAINEALVVTNAYLNAFNAIPPSADLSPDASVVVDEAVATLDAIDLLDAADNVDATAIGGAFLPDVMRIDTTLAISTSSASFAAATGGSLGILTGGRKIEDDVVDVYYSVLVGVPGLGDNVRYEGYPGLNPGQPGHKMLHGASAYNSAATFPFLADPN